MGYGQGINAICSAVRETTYGVVPGTGFKKLPFVSTTLGEERPLIEDDQLGYGRDGRDPVYDVATNDGDIVVPVDRDSFGFWLQAMFGAPITTTLTASTRYQHIFNSGAASLPSHSIEIGNPDVPSYSVHRGMVANQMRISLARSGMLNATVSMIGQGETAPISTSVAGTPPGFAGSRYAQARGVITKDGVDLGAVVSADISIGNGLDKVETIRADGRIEGVVPGLVTAQVRLQTRFNSLALLNAATDGTPVALVLGWGQEVGAAAYSLAFSLPRVFLPRVKRPITGPRGIMADFDCQASGENVDKISATMVSFAQSF